MNRSVPLWVLFFCALIWALFTVAFGWLVKSDLDEERPRGRLARAAVEVASFPTYAQEVVLELLSFVSGDYKDQSLRVKQKGPSDYSAYKPVPADSGIRLPGLLMKAEPDKMAPGWRVLAGAFHLNGQIENAALLISPDLKIVRTWVLDEIPVGGKKPRPTYRKFVHGLEVLPDGSIVFTFDGSISLQKFDACGKREWSVPGAFNHAVSLDDRAESVWTLRGIRNLVRVSVKDGSILREISLDDVIKANPEIDILEIRRYHQADPAINERNLPGPWMKDRFHLNDIDPLPAGLAGRFQNFSPGDLLLSARNLNLLFVLDPQSLKIKWWRGGAVQAQHDSDWLPNGEIVAFNNRMGRDFSEIVAINPDSFKRTVLLDGRRYNFFTRIRGKHQMLDDGTHLVTSSQQGRAFEVDRNGNVVFEVVNLKPDDKSVVYVVSELKWLPRDYFHGEAWAKCSKPN